MFSVIGTGYHWLIHRIEKFTASPSWILKLGIAGMFYALFVSFPSIDLLQKDFAANWDHTMHQSENLFTPAQFAPESHQAKQAFRLFVPVMIKLLHLNMWGVLLLKFITGVLTIIVFCHIAIKYTGDNILAVLLTAAVICTNFIKCALDVSGMFDSFALLFLLLPFLFPNAAVIFTGIFMASWVDERGLIASSLLFLFIWFYENGKKKWINTAALILAWLAYFALRLYLAKTYHLQTYSEGTGLSVLLYQVSNILMGSWIALEGLWLLIIAAIFLLYKNGMSWKALIYSGNIALILLVSLCVIDISRSMNYVVPAVILTLPVLARYEPMPDLKKLAALALLFSFLFPAYTAGGAYTVVWQYPLPLQLFRIFFM